jgi:thiosulfate dehydrogenase [quinone] large subunit
VHFDKDNCELSWVSYILRLAMASLFLVAGINKFVMGLTNSAQYVIGTFAKTWLPTALVAPYAYALPFVEVLVAVWLLSGIKLKEAWIFTAVLFVSLGFGMAVAQQYPTAASNYVYVVIACLGLYVSKYDRCALGK